MDLIMQKRQKSEWHVIEGYCSEAMSVS